MDNLEQLAKANKNAYFCATEKGNWLGLKEKKRKKSKAGEGAEAFSFEQGCIKNTTNYVSNRLVFCINQSLVKK